MTAPAFQCPSCSRKRLRAFEHRLVCDACNGMLLPADELAAAVREIDPSAGPVGFADLGDAGKTCPRGGHALRSCAISVGEVSVPEPVLRCAHDGLWISQAAIAAVFALVSRHVRVGGGGVRSSHDPGVYAPVTSGGIAAAMQSIHDAFSSGGSASGGLAISRWHHTRPQVHTLFVSAYQDRRLGCPACQGVALDYRGERWGCATCRGSFVENAALTAMVTDMTHAPWELPVLAGQPGARGCPVCGAAMAVELFEAVTIDRCAAHGVWFDDHELQDALHHASTPAPTSLGGWLKRLFHRHGKIDDDHRGS